MHTTPRLRRLPLAAGLTGFLSSSSASPHTAHMSTSSWPIRLYHPRHTTWPYTAADFRRQDSRPDTSFYSSPRFVTHIDDAAIARLRAYYAAVLPTRTGSWILDFCSSWVSHYPASLEARVAQGAVGVVGLGMNMRELERNPVLRAGRRVVGDLNATPCIADVLRRAAGIEGEEEWGFDAATNVVSTDYLTQPVAVLSSLREVMRPGGRVHLVISNRCFPTKAIARWLRVGEEERLQMVGDFLHFAGWKGIEIVELSDGSVAEEGEGGEDGLRGWMKMMGGSGSGRRDPLWVVRAVKEG